MNGRSDAGHFAVRGRLFERIVEIDRRRTLNERFGIPSATTGRSEAEAIFVKAQNAEKFGKKPKRRRPRRRLGQLATEPRIGRIAVWSIRTRGASYLAHYTMSV